MTTLVRFCAAILNPIDVRSESRCPEPVKHCPPIDPHPPWVGGTTAGRRRSGGCHRAGEHLPRVEKDLSQAPAAVGVVQQEEIQFAQPQMGLDESLIKVPGIFMQNRYDFVQDLRVSIRGFGGRHNEPAPARDIYAGFTQRNDFGT